MILTDIQKQILDILSENNYCSAKIMAEQIGVSSRSIENNIKKLKEYEILERYRSPKNGYWEIRI